MAIGKFNMNLTGAEPEKSLSFGLFNSINFEMVKSTNLLYESK
jgi:hypothetical protein